jgi:CHAT domain-containing protein
VFRGAVAIYQKALGPTHPDFATAVNNLAALYHTMGSYERAEPLFQHALMIREKALGPEHPDVAASLINLASVAAAQKNYGAAVRYLQTSSALQDRLIPNVFAFTTEKQKLQFIQTISGSYYGSLSLLHQHLGHDQSAVREGLQLVWRRKGIVFDAESRAREALQVRLSEAGRKLAKEVVALRGELAGLLLHRPANMNGTQYHAAVEALLEQIEDREQRLSSESVGVAREREQRTPDLKAVMQRLPPNAALVEFVKIRDYDFAARKWRSTWRYLAFVLAASGNVSLVDLGDTAALEAQVERAIEDIRATMVATRRRFFLKSIQSMDDLSKQVWTPLEKLVGSADKLLVSPDGILNLVPFAALRDQRGPLQGRLLVERFQLAYVSSGREVVGLEGPPPPPGINLLLVANPAFDQKNPSVGNRAASSSAQENRLNFSPLPGTEREAQEIPSLVPGQAKLKQVLVGGQATESAVKSAHSPRIMHLATHGFFLEDKVISPDQEGRGGTRKYENPLVRAGLAFAGANHASETTEGDDGILTALEITGMDLTGTELVVLSACESGVGDVQVGEGVFGLRRSFALAGAKNLMMSLWPIADEITANQMKVFYQKLQVLPPAEALRQAQLDTIRELKLEFNGLAPPALWAPFILQGAHALGQ